MKDKITSIFKNNFIFEWYYLLVILGYMATPYSSLVRPGMFAALLMLVVLIELVIKKKMNIHIFMDVLIVLYFLYKALSVIWLIKGNMPVNVYTGEFAVSLLPMIFYFVGKACGNRDRGFYGKFLTALIILGIVSLAFYVYAPQFYCDYLYDWTYISKADASTMRVRMQSFTGSTAFGAINIMGMCAGIYFLLNGKKDKKGRMDLAFGLFATIFSLVFAFLSNQRAAMVVGIALILYINILLVCKTGKRAKLYLLLEFLAEIILMVVVVKIIIKVRLDLIFKIWWRLESLPGAVSQRSEQWVAAVNNMHSSWFGNGLGANGHKALGVKGAHIIADGGLIKMYCEEGVLGFSMFIYILFLSLKKACKEITRSYAEMGIILAALLLSIGSNVLAFQLVTPIFWFAVGRIWGTYSDKDVIDFSIIKRVSNK